MRLRRNTFAAATWSESEIVRCFAAAAGAVMVAADGLSRTLEGRQAIKYVAAGEADHMIVMFENNPFVRLLGRGDTRSHFVSARCFDFPTDRRVLDVGAVNRNAGGRVMCGSRTHSAANRLHAGSLAVAGGLV